MSLIPLANPKGVKPICELCQKPAFIQCIKCRVTYYCDVEHQSIDWEGIHKKICQLLIPLRVPIPFTSGSEEERNRRKQQQVEKQEQLIELTQTEGQKLLFEGKYELAIPAAMQCLKLSIEVHGLASIQLVPSYLILAEACIGLGRASQAEEYLSQAQWTVVKIPSCHAEIKSRLHRNLGMLYATQGHYDESLRHLANDIYYSSTAFGTSHIKTSGGYFHMANVFLQQNKQDIAFSHYNQVTEIWLEHLKKLVKQRTSEPEIIKTIGPVHKSVQQATEDLDEAQAAEAVQVLNAILELRENQAVQQSSAMSNVFYALALLHMVLDDFQQARELAERAKSSTSSAIPSSHIKDIDQFLQALDRLSNVNHA